MRERQTWHDALDTQLALVRWYASTLGQRWLYASEEMNVSELPERSRSLSRDLYASEVVRAHDGRTMFVSREMCELVAAASASFKPEPIYPTDMIELVGFLYYEKPFQIRDRFDTPTTIAALSWQPILTENSLDEARNRLASRDDELIEWLEERHANGIVDGLALTIYAQTKTETPAWREEYGPPPPIVPLHVTPWFWGMSFEGNEVDVHGRPTGAEWWWRIVQTTFRLMQQRIAVKHRELPPRAQRREGKRYGIGEQPVTVVRLRREKSPAHDEPAGGAANYSHRFIVGGHWRNQWYPSEKRHRQLWIAPYVKGPEDAPLIVRDRVYTWSR